MKIRARKGSLAALAATLAATATFLFGAGHAVIAEAADGTAVVDMPHTVEDFNYPRAAVIEQETGAVLKRGNGRMVMVSCDNTEDIQVMSRTGQKDFCFDVTAKPAFLTLEVQQAYGIWTSADPVKTTVMESDGSKTVITAPANDFTGYGEAVTSKPTTLIELRVS
ncbi:hypothetical protein [Streptomyces sp. HF10]|uniref:hypothetical protein n=1 Tax=Streptomyces sp. HF10 TaxID=2692233 RepID=UPI001915E602|nr:hypothetical protein [Streptomyces sp. HF10]